MPKMRMSRCVVVPPGSAIYVLMTASVVGAFVCIATLSTLATGGHQHWNNNNNNNKYLTFQRFGRKLKKSWRCIILYILETQERGIVYPRNARKGGLSSIITSWIYNLIYFNIRRYNSNLHIQQVQRRLLAKPLQQKADYC